jgi:hypothetical protein
VLWCAIGFVGGIGLFVYGFRLLQRRRLILDTPFSKIRSASLGMVEISGLAVGPYTIAAPITGRSCYYHRTQVWEWKQHGKNKQWVKVATECMHVPFFVDDNTGCLMIDPRGADLDIHCDFKQEFNNSFFSSANDAPGSVNSFLSRHGVVTSNKVKVEEFCIKPKNALFILGTLAENPGITVTPDPICDEQPANSFSPQGFSFSPPLTSVAGDFPTGSPWNQTIVHHQIENQQEIIRLSIDPSPVKTNEMSQQQRIAAALMKAGIANPAAWSAAGVTADDSSTVGVATDPNPEAKSNATANSGSAANGFPLHPPVVLTKGKSDKTFLISWRSQQQVARSMGAKCTLMIWGGALLAVTSLYVLHSVWTLIQ